MIETGTTDELKESVLGNLGWAPDNADLVRTKRAFENEGVEVTQCFIKQNPVGKGDRYTVAHTIKVYFQTKRSPDAALTMTKRATRALRLAMCAFTEETPGMSPAGTKVYTAE